MDCQDPDTPINAIVQTLFIADKAPGLRALTQLVHKVYGRARTSILPGGARYDLPGTGVLEVSCDLVTERHRMAILTFTLTPADAAQPDTDPERLDWQNRTLDRLVRRLDPAQTHWHMLPGPIGRIAGRRLARRSLELLSRRVWTAKADVADPGIHLARRMAPPGAPGRRPLHHRRIADPRTPRYAAPDRFAGPMICPRCRHRVLTGSTWCSASLRWTQPRGSRFGSRCRSAREPPWSSPPAAGTAEAHRSGERRPHPAPR